MSVEIKDREREERLRLERVAVGRICGCKDCVCCEELRKHTETKRKENV